MNQTLASKPPPGAQLAGALNSVARSICASGMINTAGKIPTPDFRRRCPLLPKEAHSTMLTTSRLVQMASPAVMFSANSSRSLSFGSQSRQTSLRTLDRTQSGWLQAIAAAHRGWKLRPSRSCPPLAAERFPFPVASASVIGAFVFSTHPNNR